jgi:hypothetical protein
MKRLLTIFTLLFFSITAKSQLDKGVWLVGGNGNFSSSSGMVTNTLGIQKSTYTNIALSPNVGYFIIDKLAGGLRARFSSDKYKYGEVINGGIPVASGGVSNIKRFDIGPFVRYYFLNKEKQSNIFAEINYLYGYINIKPEKGSSNTFSFNAGPVIYFNSSVGIEFTLGYISKIEKIKGVREETKNSFQAGIGLQIHLENL